MLLKASLLLLAALPGLARRNLPARRLAVRNTEENVTTVNTVPLWPANGPDCDDVTEAQVPNGPLAAVLCAVADRANGWLQTAVRNNNANTSAEFHLWEPQNELSFENATTETGGTLHGTYQSFGGDPWLPVTTDSLGDSLQEDATCWWPAGFQNAFHQIPVHAGDLEDHQEKFMTMLTNREGRWVTDDSAKGYYDIMTHAESTPVTLWTRGETSTLKAAKAYTVWKAWIGPENTMKAKIRDPYGTSDDYKVEEIFEDIKLMVYLKNWDEFTNYPGSNDTEVDEPEGDCPCARRRRRDRIFL